jgi:hypothetical protein
MWRSVVLVAVVFAVVITPIFAMIRKTDAAEFSQYVTPITAIAGTVLGYWFVQQGQSLRRKSQRSADPQTAMAPRRRLPNLMAQPGEIGQVRAYD